MRSNLQNLFMLRGWLIKEPKEKQVNVMDAYKKIHAVLAESDDAAIVALSAIGLEYDENGKPIDAVFGQFFDEAVDGMKKKPTPPPERNVDEAGRTLVVKGNVLQDERGRKHVAHSTFEIPPGTTLICSEPHKDGDYSYSCGNKHCQCMQQ